VIAAVHGVVFGLALDSLGRFRRRFQNYRVGHWVGGVCLARASKLVGNAWRLHEAVGAHILARRTGCGRSVWCRRRAWIACRGLARRYRRVCGGHCMDGPVIVVGTDGSPRMRSIIRAFFCALMNTFLFKVRYVWVFFCASSTAIID
jgi:hypothetical protein